jgi:adenylate cyclase
MSAGTSSVPLVGRPLAGQQGEGERLARRTSMRVGLAEMVAGGWGAVDVFLLLWFVLPAPEHPGISESTLLLVNAAALAVYMALAGAAGMYWGKRSFETATGWLREGRAPTERERSSVLCQPLTCAGLDFFGWSLAAVVFFLINLPAGSLMAFHVASVIFMGGLTCTALGYLLVERIMRPVTARALSFGPVQRPKGPGVTARLLLAWVFATGVPLGGLVLLGCKAVAGEIPADNMDRLAISVVALAAIAAMSGLAATWLVARSVSDPLTAMRRAIGRIEGGDLSARVTVEDGSEVGLLQSGFNAMAGGLAERERIRDLFGRHVGEDVARAAIDRHDALSLGGEVRDVAAVFIDLIGSTSLAARRPPRDVVRLLNDFFAVVVEVVERHGGWVNKFEGDAALCVFGAPGDHPDAAGAALAAGRELRRRLHVLPDVDAAIGISAGPAVAGNVGAERRFEYTVIGDPVNEAARLCELAKRRDGRLVASGVALDRSVNGEGERWECCDEVVLRGRRRPTLIAEPV